MTYTQTRRNVHDFERSQKTNETNVPQVKQTIRNYKKLDVKRYESNKNEMNTEQTIRIKINCPRTRGNTVQTI